MQACNGCTLEAVAYHSQYPTSIDMSANLAETSIKGKESLAKNSKLSDFTSRFKMATGVVNFWVSRNKALLVLSFRRLSND